MFLGLHPFHWVIIAIVAFVIFGPKRLPQIGRSLAKAVRDLRSGMKEMGEEFHGVYEKPADQAPGASPVTAVQPEMPTAAATIEKPVATAPASDGHFCTNCGAANPPASRFCHKCGQQLTTVLKSEC